MLESESSFVRSICWLVVGSLLLDEESIDELDVEDRTDDKDELEPDLFRLLVVEPLLVVLVLLPKYKLAKLRTTNSEAGKLVRTLNLIVSGRWVVAVSTRRFTVVFTSSIDFPFRKRSESLYYLFFCIIIICCTSLKLNLGF